VSQLEFDQRLVDRLERLYATRDVLRRRELVRAALDVRPGDRILDVGCGPGFYLTELQDSRFPRQAAPAAWINHDDVTLSWSGPRRCHFVVVARDSAL
jgi:trans-aconitate methyltransferase